MQRHMCMTSLNEEGSDVRLRLEQTPEEINPLSSKDYLTPDPPSQSYGKALTILGQQVLPHSDNIHRNHQLFLPAISETLLGYTHT